MPFDAISAPALSFNPALPYFLPYGRCSSAVQLKGETVRRQEGEGENSNEAVAARLGLPCHPGKFFDALSGFTGAHLLNGVLGKIIEEALTGKMPKGSVLGLDEWTRFSRQQVRKSASLALQVINAGVGIYIKKTGKLYSADELDKLGPLEGTIVLLMAFLELAAGRAESQEKGRKVSETKGFRHDDAAKAEGGLVLSKQLPAFLQVVGRDGGPAGNFKDDPTRRVVERPDQAAVVRRVFDENKYFGAASITAGLQRDWENRKEGDRHKPFGLALGRKHGSTGWHVAAVEAILKNPAAKGHVRRIKWWTDPETGQRKRQYSEETYRNKAWPQIISEEDWQEAQDIIAGRRERYNNKAGKRAGKGGKRGTGMPNMLQGFTKCAACHGPMGFYKQVIGSPGRRKDSCYLQCRKARMGAGCGHKRRHAYPALEALVGEVARGFLFRPGTLDTATGPSPTAAEVKRLTDRAASLQKRFDRWNNEENDDIREAGREEASRVAKELKQARADLADAERRLALENSGARQEDHIALVGKLWGAATAAEDTPERTVARVRVNGALAAVLDNIACLPNGTVGIAAGGGKALAVRAEGKPLVVLVNHDDGAVTIETEKGGHRFTPGDALPPVIADARAMADLLGRMGADARRAFDQNVAALPSAPPLAAE